MCSCFFTSSPLSPVCFHSGAPAIAAQLAQSQRGARGRGTLRSESQCPSLPDGHSQGSNFQASSGTEQVIPYHCCPCCCHPTCSKRCNRAHTRLAHAIRRQSSELLCPAMEMPLMPTRVDDRRQRVVEVCHALGPFSCVNPSY